VNGNLRGGAVLIVNTGARHGRDRFDSVRGLLAAGGVPLAAAIAAESGAALVRAVREAVAGGARMIVLGGGDGTVSAAVDHLVNGDTVLGILPLGTANSFARSVNIPLDLEAAVEVIAAGRVAAVDLGRINEDYFANVATIGFSTAIGATMPPLLKKALGRFSYPVVGAGRLLRHQPFRCTIEDEAGAHSFRCLEVRIANGAFQGGVRISEEADVRSGEIVIQVMKAESRLQVVRSWARMAAGSAPLPSDMASLRVRKARLTADPVQEVSVDGERTVSTPVDISVAPHALRLIVP
jgi:YegS/Rv2252/BmrU family lipid kinase